MDVALLIKNSDGLNIRPNLFKCRITPRSGEIKRTIEREGRQATEDLSVYSGETKFRISTYSAKD